MTLTPRQTEIVAEVSRGLQNKEIASNLGISMNTVKAHLQRILEKTGYSNRTELAMLAGIETELRNIQYWQGPLNAKSWWARSFAHKWPDYRYNVKEKRIVKR